MMSFKFEYEVKPSIDYNIGYGLKNKFKPYSFNFPVSLKNGNYRFGYDRRDQIHIEERDESFVSWRKDMHLEENTNPLIKKIHEMEIAEEKELEKLIKKEILSIDSNLEFESIHKQLYKDVSIELKKNRAKEVFTEESLNLEKTKLKYLDIYRDFLLKRNTAKELIKENPEHSLGFRFQKEIITDEDLEGLDKPIGEMTAKEHALILETINKALEKDLEGQFYKNDRFGLEIGNPSSKLENNSVEFWYEEIERALILNLFKKLDKNKTMELTSDFTKVLDIEKIGVNLSRVDETEIVVRSVILLSKLSNEININQKYGPFFKILNEIYKYEELIGHALSPHTTYDIEKDGNFTEIEIGAKEMERFKDQVLDKTLKVDLEIEKAFKKLINNTKHELQIEECFRQAEEVYEIIIDIDKRMKQLEKEYIVDLYQEKDIHRLIKKLIIHDLITEEESLELEKSPIGKMLIEHSASLNKNQKEIEIIIDESMPMVKAYREIIINNDIQATKESIEININKEKEFGKVVHEIRIEKNETKIKFNKRFWFLRATDPFDWKVLPYSDYPYRKEPIVFNNDKKIPDNWQLEMIPKLHQEVKDHPMPFGQNLGDEEMALSIEIMIDVINIMILIWSRMFYNFSGYTGSQAVIRFTKLLYDWLMLETSIEEMEKKDSKEHYFRAYRWIRWEAEKVAIKARDDMRLSGNMYIDEWIFELIYYMENHHFDTMPIFDVIGKMDEFRALLRTDDPQGDIDFILDKVKGMRHKIIECKANKSNE